MYIYYITLWFITRSLISLEPIFILYSPVVNATDRSISPWKSDVDRSIALLQESQ